MDEERIKQKLRERREGERKERGQGEGVTRG